MILSGASEPPKSSGFLTIAPELRAMIYTELIASGKIAILQVSKQVHDEAKYHLYMQGICRLQFSCGRDYVDIFDPPESPLSDVQNFNLKIYIGRFPSNFHMRPLARIGRLDDGLQPWVQGSGTCHVTLVFESPDDFHIPDSVLFSMRCLGTFKLVTLRVHFKDSYHPLDRRNKDTVRSHRKKMIKQISDLLEMSLGSSDWKSEPCDGPLHKMLSRPSIFPFVAAPYLEFHPPGAGMSQSKPGSTMLHV